MPFYNCMILEALVFFACGTSLLAWEVWIGGFVPAAVWLRRSTQPTHVHNSRELLRPMTSEPLGNTAVCLLENLVDRSNLGQFLPIKLWHQWSLRLK